MDSFHNWVRETSIDIEEKLSRTLKPEEIDFLKWVEATFLDTEKHI